MRVFQKSLLPVIVIFLSLTLLAPLVLAQGPAPAATQPTGGTWITYTNGNDVTALAIEGNTLWAATTGGVVKWDMTTGNYEKFTTTDGLADNNVSSITIDSAGNRWFGTNGGVSVLQPASLAINHTTGKPGSYFTVTGIGYPANSTAAITINGRSIGTLQTDSNGAFTFELNTLNAGDGAYFVTVTVNPSATIKFTLDTASPDTWASGGAGTSFNVPAGIAFTQFVYLPLIQR